jgi:CubicO group peptidase (beta-lactamase class C family)
VAFLLAACSAGSGAGLSQPSGSATTVVPDGNPCAEGYPSAQLTPHYPPASGRPLARSLARSLDSVLTDLPDVGRRSGLTAAVVTDRGTWVGVAGHALDGSRLRRSSSLAIGSVTKTFTAAEVLHLVAAGRIDLGRRISAFVPRHSLVPVILIVERDLPHPVVEIIEVEFIAIRAQHWRHNLSVRHLAVGIGDGTKSSIFVGCVSELIAAIRRRSVPAQIAV